MKYIKAFLSLIRQFFIWLRNPLNVGQYWTCRSLRYFIYGRNFETGQWVVKVLHDTDNMTRSSEFKMTDQEWFRSCLKNPWRYKGFGKFWGLHGDR